MYHGEKFNAWTHLVGALLALAGALWLLALAVAQRRRVENLQPWRSMARRWSCSTAFRPSITACAGGPSAILRKLDHLSIYLLIAGSYTPFCLITLRGPWGWSLFGVVWTLALIGMLQEIKPRSEARVMSLVIYAVMGWIVLVAIKPLIAGLGMAGFIWLAAGGRPVHRRHHLLCLRRALSATGMASGTCS
jgi:hemolysin III